MSIRRLLAVARKEFRHITRDARTFFLVTVAPAFLLFTLSYVFSFDVERVYIGVRDLDHTPLSRGLVANLIDDGDVIIVAYVEREEEIEPLFTQDTADVVLVIHTRLCQRSTRKWIGRNSVHHRWRGRSHGQLCHQHPGKPHKCLCCKFARRAVLQPRHRFCHQRPRLVQRDAQIAGQYGAWYVGCCPLYARAGVGPGVDP